MGKLKEDSRVFDVLLRAKDGETGSDTDEAIIFPITKFDNCLGGPKVVKNVSNSPGGSPYLFRTEEHEINESEYSAYFAHVE